MRALVTGANGLLGSRLCRELSSRGHEVFATGRGPRRMPGAHPYFEVELSSAAQVAEAFQKVRPELVLHSASMTDVDGCERRPEEAYACNVEATANLARSSKKAGAHLVYVSTDYVFDGVAGPYSEEALPNPRGVYAATKYAAELCVRALCPSFAIARTAVVFGWPAASRPNFATWLTETLLKGQPARLFEDQHVSPSLADSVAQMLSEIAERRLPGVWNTCGAEVIDRVSFGRVLCEELGLDPGLLIASRMADVALPSPRPARAGLTVDKVRRELEAKPLGVREAIRRFAEQHASK